jgi:hypothetical protein
MKLGISPQDLLDFISTRLDLMKNTSNSEGASKVNPKPGVKFTRGPICEKTSLVPFIHTYIHIYHFLSTIFILTFDFILFGKTGAQYTQFGVLYG